MSTQSYADIVPVCLVAERLHRLATLTAWGRLPFARTFDQCSDRDVRRAASRRELVRNLEAARRLTHA